MSIENIFEKMKTATPELNHRLGMRQIFKEDSPPRCVWVPVRSTLSAPEGQGGDGVTGGDATFQVAQHPVRTRNVQYEIHLWGANFSHCEEMMERFVTAAIDAMAGAVEFESEEWILPDGTLKKGDAVVLGITIKQPLLERKTVVTTPALLQETSEMDFNGDIFTDHTVTG